MSHIVRITTEVRDVAAARAACQRLQLETPVEGRAQLFSGEATGLIVKLPEWQYPVVFDTSTGEAKCQSRNTLASCEPSGTAFDHPSTYTGWRSKCCGRQRVLDDQENYHRTNQTERQINQSE